MPVTNYEEFLEHECSDGLPPYAVHYRDGFWQIFMPPNSIPITHCPYCGEDLEQARQEAEVKE